MKIFNFIKCYFENILYPFLLFFLNTGLFFINLYLMSPSIRKLNYIILVVFFLSITISTFVNLLKKRWRLAIDNTLLIFSTIFALAAYSSVHLIIFGVDPYKETIRHNGNKYGYGMHKTFAFRSDTIQADFWSKTINVDGDNKRVLRILAPAKNFNFSLPNSVNNFTHTTYYCLLVNKHKYLWIEDNFGTTVIDINLMKKVKTKKSSKKLTEIAPSGSPIGINKPLSINDFKKQLSLKEKNKVILLDSISFLE